MLSSLQPVLKSSASNIIRVASQGKQQLSKNVGFQQRMGQLQLESPDNVNAGLLAQSNTDHLCKAVGCYDSLNLQSTYNLQFKPMTCNDCNSALAWLVAIQFRFGMAAECVCCKRYRMV